ncbi:MULTISPECIES: CxxH/CxxC protein [Bacillaceae]|uniref:CxxH/CxxC protein n=1 Tax=Bacillaceae TaxID=186817 RepID=UPI001BDDD373|nr:MULTISPECIES: CxxH/CxxC protein [Bacillaceae]MDX8360945.1 CxxH/CxxC protein [Cytobacillus sp. IB215316]
MKCCDEHIDLAIDMYVDEHEIAPEINMLNEEEKLSTCCEFCRNQATYIVGN